MSYGGHERVLRDHESVLRRSRKCLKGVTKVSSGGHESVLKESRKCLKGVMNVY